MGSQNSRVSRVQFRTRLVITNDSSAFIDPQLEIEGKRYHPTVVFDDVMTSRQGASKIHHFASTASTTHMNIVINGQSFLKRKSPTRPANKKDVGPTPPSSMKYRGKEKLKKIENINNNKNKKVEELPHPDSREGISFAIEKSKKILGVLVKKKMKDTMIKHMNYIIDVLQTISESKARKLLEEDVEPEEVLSEVETKDYPSEVRDWLTMTFTRSMSNVRKTEDKLHFRGVATAIRAGIVVDRIYRRLSSSIGIHVPPNVLLQMKELDEWAFDVFKINDIGDGHALKYVGYELFQKHDIINKFKVNTNALDSFLNKVEQGYCKFNNPYHNHIHGADVTQTTHFLITNTDLLLWLTDLEVFAVLTSALIHDYEHTGTTNAFQINTKSDLAYLYNDRNVLENHHASASFKLMREDSNNILNSLSTDDFKSFRTLIIDIVLATDMSFHFQQLKNMKNLLTTPENIDKSKALSLLVHCADISHPAKKWSLHEKWTNLLVEEFFRQGDREAELNLPISPLCDRNNTVVAKSQIGFIDFIVDPSFQVLGDMLDKIVVPIRDQQRSADTESERKLSTLSSTSSNFVNGEFGESLLVTRHWESCLRENKQCWQDKAAKDAELEEERLVSPNLGVVSSSVVASDSEEKKRQSSTSSLKENASHQKSEEHPERTNSEKSEQREVSSKNDTEEEEEKKEEEKQDVDS